MKLLYKHIIENQDLGLKLANPIRQFFGIDENENIRRIYWNDGVMPPRSLNVINTPEIIDPDLLNFSPPSNIGQINYYSEINGNLDCASYFFVFRLVSSDGAVTEYSFPTLPISIAADKIEGSNTYYKYQTYQGANFDIKSTSGIKVKVTNIDTRYKYIQVVAFKSIAYNTYVGGTLIANEEIGTNTTMFFNYTGSESLGSVSIADINISSMFIEQTDLMEIVKNKNVLANFKEKEELPEGDIITYSQVNGVALTKEYYQIPVDSKVDMNLYNVETSTTINDKPLHGIAINHAYLYKDFWYKNTSTGAFILGDGLTAKTSIYVPYIRIVKYTTSLGEKIYDNIPLNNEFMNYKGKKISSLLKGYIWELKHID